MLALSHEGVVNEPEQSSRFPAERVLPSGKGDGKSKEGVGRIRPCWRKVAQEDGTYLEQGRPPADCRSAKATLGQSAETGGQASQVITAAVSQTPQMASFVTSP